MKKCKIFVSLIICVIVTFTLALPLNAIADECEHEFGEWSIESEATCTLDGVEIKICNKCKYKQYTIIEKALGHSFENDECANCGVSLGDVNLDSNIDMLDLIKLNDELLLSPEKYDVVYDINKDSSFDSADVTAMRKTLFATF